MTSVRLCPKNVLKFDSMSGVRSQKRSRRNWEWKRTILRRVRRWTRLLLQFMECISNKSMQYDNKQSKIDVYKSHLETTRAWQQWTPRIQLVRHLPDPFRSHQYHPTQLLKTHSVPSFCEIWSRCSMKLSLGKWVSRSFFLRRQRFLRNSEERGEYFRHRRNTS